MEDPKIIFRDLLNRGLQALHLPSPSEEQINSLLLFQELILKWNQKINLTAHRTLEESLEKNFLDSIALNPYLGDSKDVLDIGSGAGFPGLVLKILNPPLRIFLVEANKKKGSFLTTVTRELSLEEAKIITGFLDLKNMDDFGFRERFDTIVSRATIPLSDLISLASACLKKGGRFFGMGGKKSKVFKEGEKISGMKLEKKVSFHLPFSKLQREILIFVKI